jgi:hypothetical protein
MPIIGTAMSLVGGTLTLTAIPGDQYWFIQNQSTTAILNISIPSKTGSVQLNAATVTDVGGWLDSYKFPFRPTSFLLTSTDLTAQFCAWSSPEPPEMSQARSFAPFLDSGRR